MAYLIFTGLVVTGVALAVWRSGASRRNRDDVRQPSPDGSRDRGGLPGGGDGGFSGVGF